MSAKAADTPRPATPRAELWGEWVGDNAPRVYVAERADKGGVVYVRVWDAHAGKKGNWRHRSLEMRVRSGTGRLIEAACARARAEAKRLRQRLVDGLPLDERPEASARLTLADGLALVTDPNRGKYKVDTRHRREVQRSLAHVMRTLGRDKLWETMELGDLSEVWCTRIRELRAEGEDGHRGSAIVLRDLLAVARWLRAHKHIPVTACVFDGGLVKQMHNADWLALAGSQRAYAPKRPRHADADAFRAILRAAEDVDPRLALLLQLGAEGRGGQVQRCRRTDLDLAKGRLTVPGLKTKQGLVVHLTAGQQAAAERALGLTDPTTGYLRELERLYQAGAIADYPLFPSTQLRGTRRGAWREVAGKKTRGNYVMTPALGYAVAKHATVAPLSMERFRELFHEAEAKAGIAWERGRALYGLRRVSLDVGTEEEGLSVEATQEFGGWADIQTPARIYRDQQRRRARDQARDVRARLRGEDQDREDAGREADA